MNGTPTATRRPLRYSLAMLLMATAVVISFIALLKSRSETSSMRQRLAEYDELIARAEQQGDVASVQPTRFDPNGKTPQVAMIRAPWTGNSARDLVWRWDVFIPQPLSYRMHAARTSDVFWGPSGSPPPPTGKGTSLSPGVHEIRLIAAKDPKGDEWSQNVMVDGQVVWSQTTKTEWRGRIITGVPDTPVTALQPLAFGRCGPDNGEGGLQDGVLLWLEP